MILKESIQQEFNELQRDYYRGQTVYVHANSVLHWAIAQLLDVPEIHTECLQSIQEQLPKIQNSVEFGKAILNYYTIEQTDYAAALRDAAQGYDGALDVNRYPVELVRDTLDASIYLLERSRGEGIRVQPHYLSRGGIAFFETIMVQSIRETAQNLGWKPFYHFSQGNGPGLEGRIATDIPGRLPVARARAEKWQIARQGGRPFVFAT